MRPGIRLTPKFARTQSVKDDVSGKDAECGGPAAGRPRASLRYHPCTYIGLFTFCMLVILVAGMVPVYLNFHNLNKQQEQHIVYPFGLTAKESEELPTSIHVNADLTHITPTDHVITLSIEVMPVLYESDADSGTGIVELPSSDLVLDIALGHQSITYSDGDHFSDVSMSFSLDDSWPGFMYPMDKYEVDMLWRAYLVNSTDDSDTLLPISIALLLARQGWETSASITEVVPGNDSQGVRVKMTFVRSASVKFFAMFMVTILWLISIAAFAVALLYLYGSEEEATLEVPALLVALLFALPFVRDVMPEVPEVGIRIDLLGYFWNMLLVSVSVAVVLAKAGYVFHLRLKGPDRSSTHSLGSNITPASVVPLVQLAPSPPPQPSPQ